MKDLIFMRPCCREVIWGGRRLREIYGYKTNGDHTGEAWVVSANENGQSVADRGEYEGKTLKELWDNHRELFGNLPGEEFPLLVKIIDAREDLSIQVHPDDDYARAHENGARGKNECWYILDCPEDGDIIIGHHAQNKEQLKTMVENQQWDRLLNVIPIHRGDCFYIPSGTVHAIRKGTLLLEIQQNSDLTYRLYDYGRLQNGKPRELHLKKSLDVVRCPSNLINTREEKVCRGDYTSCILVRSPFFTVERWIGRGEQEISQSHPFMILDILEGEGTINGEPARKGDHLIATAGCKKIQLKGEFELTLTWV